MIFVADSNSAVFQQMALKHVSKLSELDEILKNHQGLVVIDFFATWCGPCKMIAPKFEQMAAANPGVVFVKVDVDRSPDLTNKYDISAMPTFIFIKGGQVVETLRGADPNTLDMMVQRHGTKPQKPTPRPIPSDDELTKMSSKQLLQLMAEHNISSVGLPEKGDLIDELRKNRR